MRRKEPAFAFGVAGVQKAPWRPTQDEARADALDAGWGSADEHSGTIYLDTLAEIWTTHELVAAFPRALVPGPKKNGPTSDRPLTRIERIIARREAHERAIS